MIRLLLLWLLRLLLLLLLLLFMLLLLLLLIYSYYLLECMNILKIFKDCFEEFLEILFVSSCWSLLESQETLVFDCEWCFKDSLSGYYFS